MSLDEGSAIWDFKVYPKSYWLRMKMIQVSRSLSDLVQTRLVTEYGWELQADPKAQQQKSITASPWGSVAIYNQGAFACGLKGKGAISGGSYITLFKRGYIIEMKPSEG